VKDILEQFIVDIDSPETESWYLDMIVKDLSEGKTVEFWIENKLHKVYYQDEELVLKEIG